MPIVPLFIIPGMWALDQMLKPAPLVARLTIPVILVALQLTMYIPALREELRNTYERKNVLAMATDALEQTVPEGSVVVADQSLLQHLDFVRKWKLADASLVSGRSFGARARPPGPDGDDQDQPSPQQRDKMIARMNLYTGSTEQKQKKFLDDIERWAGDSDVYVVGKEDALRRLLPQAKNIQVVQRIKVPARPPEPTPPNAFGRGGFGNRPRGGGPFGGFVQPGEEFVIARW